MEKDEIGEHSRKNEKNDGGDRPLKKAKYVWQLKGKYHLKKQYKNKETKTTENGNHSNRQRDLDRENLVNNNNNNNVEPEHNNNICSSMCCIDSILARCGEGMDDSEIRRETECERTVLDEIPISLVAEPKQQDRMLHKWQARQVAKSFVDNTINSILEHCKLAPFDATDIIENCENGEKVEDEGILMAIQSHGLQSSSASTHFHSSPSLGHLNAKSAPKYSNSNQNIKCKSSSSDKLQHIEESTLDNLENTQNEMEKENIPRDTGMEEENCEKTHDNNEEPMAMDNPMDFLNAAVTVAIQKKGLTSYSYG